MLWFQSRQCYRPTDTLDIQKIIDEQALKKNELGSAIAYETKIFPQSLH
jgi:hypothetical protein